MADFSQDGIIDLLARTTDKDGWLDPQLADPDGAAALLALVAQFTRMGKAVDYTGMIGMISTAPGGNAGTCILVLSRSVSGTAGTIPAGYQFADERGVRMIVSTPVPVAGGALQILLPLQTLRQTEAVNTEDDAAVGVAPDAGVVLDVLGTTALLAPAGSPSVVATTFQFPVSTTQILGGASDWLAIHGAERGQIRQTGEDTASYRARVINIPDAVSPKAICLAVQGAASRGGLPLYFVLEPFPQTASPAITVPLGLGSFKPFFADDATYGFAGDVVAELVSRREATAYFRLEPQAQIQDAVVKGLFCDFGFLDDTAYGFADTGPDPAVNASLLSMWADVFAKKAGGVNFDLFVGEPLRLVGVGHTALNAETVVWTLNAPVGKAWIYVDGYFGHNFELAPLPTTLPLPASHHKVRFTFSDATTFTTASFFPHYEERITLQNFFARGAPQKTITKIEGIVQSDGTHPSNFVGVVLVAEMAP